MSAIKGTLMRKNAPNAQELDPLYPKTSIDNVEGYDAAAASKLAGNTIQNTTAWFTTNNPVLLAGQYGYETGTGLFKVGDGVTAWNSLPYVTAVTPLANMSVELDDGTGTYEEQMNNSVYMEVWDETEQEWIVVPN